MSLAATVDRVGRFELKKVLGRGAQATVWLAHDTRLDREVAVKLLEPSSAEHEELDQWLHEARAVSRLKHPNVVPVFEADERDGKPYLVFEYVEGETLSAARRERGAFPPREAVELVLGVLDALAAAHELGIVHRDLKPSNVLVGRDGRARVMDFGIAAHVEHGGDGRIVGTPGYMSPEAARGEPPTPAMDVFAAGMVLAELLAGKPLLFERDPYKAVRRVQREDFSLPATVRVDDSLRGIVARSLAREPAQRYDAARSMRDALAAWLNPEPSERVDAAEGKGTLEFLLRRMRHKRDFPALSKSIVKVQQLATSDTETLAGLTAEILKDVALTNKLLRMVNTVHFAQAGAGGISTVSRAVALVGFAGIRNMALSVVLLEHMQDQEQAAQMREEFLRALMAGTIAVEMASGAREAEEAFIGAMFQNLGRMLTEYYFPEEAQQIRQLLRDDPTDPMRHEAISAQVLGLGFQDLGQGVARSWGLPDDLVQAMKMPPGDTPPRDASSGREYRRWLGRAANEISQTMLNSAEDLWPVRLGRLAERYGPSLGLTSKGFLAATAGAHGKLNQLAQGLGLRVGPTEPARKLLDGPSGARQADAAGAPAGGAAATGAAAAAAAASKGRQDGCERLAVGIQKVTELLATDGFRLNDVLKAVLDAMHEAIGFDRVILCLRDPRNNMLSGRFGVGRDAAAASRCIQIAPSGSATDIFAAVCFKGLDLQIDDAAVDHVARRLPAWYRQHLRAPCFLLLPMKLRELPFGLIYADGRAPGSLALSAQELSMLRTLRSQAVMAFKQIERG